MIYDVFDDQERLSQRYRVPVGVSIVLPVFEYVPAVLAGSGRVGRVPPGIAGRVKP